MKYNKIFIKKMTKEHINDILEVERRCFSKPWNKAMFENELENEKTNYLVMMIDDNVVGYIGTWYILDEAHITNVCIDTKYQGEKLGEKLVNELIKLSRENGIEKMTLEVRESNEKALSLYKKTGFKSMGRRKRYYTNPCEDAIIMWRTLKGVEEV